MRAGETLVDRAGNQVALFPLEYMDISQGEGGSYSHAGRWAIDFWVMKMVKENLNVHIVVKIY